MIGNLLDGAGQRTWRWTIAAKLLLAFIVIATLTAIAALVAVLQFGRIEHAMGQLTGESLPAVKFSLAVESNARAIAAAGAQLAGVDLRRAALFAHERSDRTHRPAVVGDVAIARRDRRLGLDRTRCRR